MRKTVCVDLDGVLAQYDEWRGVEHFGQPIPGAVEFTRRLSEKYEVVIFTARCNEGINRPEKPVLLASRVREWLDEHHFAYDYVYAEAGKPLAAAYVDDRAVVCRPEDWDSPDIAFDCAFTSVDLLCRALPKGEL